MPSLRPSEIDELMLDDDELTDIQLRRKKRREKKAKPYDAKFVKDDPYEDKQEWGRQDSTE